MSEKPNQTQTKRFATVRQAAALYPAFTESSFRWYIFNAKRLNFDKCIRRVGRKILIELDEFEQWLDGNTATGAIK